MLARANLVQRGDPVYASGRKRSRATPCHNKTERTRRKPCPFLWSRRRDLNPRPLGPSSQHALIVSLCLRQRRRLYGRLLLSPKKRYSFYSGTPYMVRDARGHGQPRHSATQQKKDRAKPYLFCWSRRRDLNPRLLVPRRNTPLLSAFAYVKGIDFTVGCSSPRKNATRFIRGPRIMVRDARGHGQPRHSATQQKKDRAKPYLFCWSRRRDLNPRPLGPEPSALPNCATPRR